MIGGIYFAQTYFAQALNPIETIWSKVGRVTSTWTKVSRTTTAWLKHIRYKQL